MFAQHCSSHKPSPLLWKCPMKWHILHSMQERVFDTELHLLHTENTKKNDFWSILLAPQLITITTYSSTLVCWSWLTFSPSWVQWLPIISSLVGYSLWRLSFPSVHCFDSFLINCAPHAMIFPRPLFIFFVFFTKSYKLVSEPKPLWQL